LQAITQSPFQPSISALIRRLFYFLIMARAQCLLTITPPSDPGDSPSISLNRHTLAELLFNFKGIRVFYPILVFGSYRKPLLIASIMRLAGITTGGERTFEARDSDPDGVYVWPQPLQLGDLTILLLKMRGDPGSEDTADVRRRVRACVVPLSLICCMKEEMTKSLAEIQCFVQDYYPLRERLGLETAKLVVCAEENWYTKNQCKSILTALIAQHSGLFEVRYPDSNGFWLQLADLQSESFKAPYTRTHNSLPVPGDSQDYMSSFLSTLSLFVRISDLSFTFSAYIDNVPNPRNPAAEQKVAEVGQVVLSAKRIRSSAQTLDFLVKREGSSGYVFDQRTLETIQLNYQLTEPTVVLVVMGAPGLGKSTLLNAIIQYCVESEKLNLFSTGSTGGHTTRGSQILSYPLYYKGTQIMLVDLEGLGGTETLSTALSILQANLVSALLTVASVPCILVRNEATSLESAKKTITQIAKLQETFGFKIERIYLLFHDHNIDAALNSDFEEFRIGVNSKFFRNVEVVKMLNKPNFKEANCAENRRFFLHSFLSESLYVKKNASDSFVNISDLITNIGVITKHKSTLLKELRLTMNEVKEYDRFVSFLHVKLREITANLKPPNQVPLLSLFNEKIRVEFTPEKEAKFTRMSDALKAHCQLRADLDVETAKVPLAEIEAYHNFIRVVPENQMVENIKQIVDGYHKAAWSIVAFLPRLSLLEVRLHQVHYHFPDSQPKMTKILIALDSKKRSCIAWTAAGYTAQTALAMVTLGISTVFTAGGSIAYSQSAAGRGVTMETSNLESLGQALGQSAGPTWAAGICTNLIFPKKAAELVWVNSAWGNGQVNERILEPLGKNLANKAPIVLIIGSKSTSASDFANCFMRYISPFSLDEFAAFHPNIYTQALLFDYFNPGMSQTAIPGYVICLRMKKKPRSDHSETMLKVAETLMPIASVACLLVDKPHSYAHALLNALCPPKAPDDQGPKIAVLPTKVMVISSHREALEDLESALTRGCVAYEPREVANFSKSTLVLAAAAVKDALDSSQPQAAALLLDKISTLPRVLQRVARV